ncbi:MAG: MBOAT family protein [Bacillaceae bacterium]|nr:MBOAT family protein [Bacillaceae bacterium]
MIFNTLIYGLFLITFFILYWFVIPARWRPISMLTASFIFFSYHFFIHTLLILGLTILVYVLGQAIHRYDRKKLFMTLGVVLTLGTLAYYKYTELVVSTLNDLFILMEQSARLPVPDIVVPLGISFFTFQYVHYLVDVYRGETPKSSFVEFAVYIMFFPTLVSGPIERFQRFNLQTHENLGRFRREYLFEGFTRIMIGLFKKIVIADSLTPFTEGLQMAGLDTVDYWIAAYAYAIKIYMDFSGYSDIAIGSARLFGYRIMENFNWPYLQRNLSLFWRNWHMSLTSWFRDYLYIPLGGSRVRQWKAIRNILIVWAATGIWHGAAWHFMGWGLFHAFGLIVLRFYTQYLAAYVTRFIRHDRVMAGLSGLLTFHYVVVGWVFFVCDFKQSLYVISRMFGING